MRPSDVQVNLTEAQAYRVTRAVLLVETQRLKVRQEVLEEQIAVVKDASDNEDITTLHSLQLQHNEATWYLGALATATEYFGE